jgi:hypothetical protein
MIMSNISLPQNRLGLHYFPDDLHYREKDLQTWLPEIQALGAAWLTLIAPAQRSIPEGFLQGLISAGIQPILHFPLSTQLSATDEGLWVLFSNYARWGVRYVVLFDRPNTRQAWTPTHWTQSDLVERFLDIFLPKAEQALQAGLIPSLPPFEPGGDYWDTAFLQSALKGIQRRGNTHLLDSLSVSAYAWTYDRPINWGAGGPERWPNAKPYRTQSGSEDQLGFRIFDWYNALIESELGTTRPIIVLRAGGRAGDLPLADGELPDLQKHTIQNLRLAQYLNPKPDHIAGLQSNSSLLSLDDEEEPFDPLPDSLIVVNYWLLAAEHSSPDVASAWYQPDGRVLPVVSAMKQWAAISSPLSIAEEEISQPGNSILQKSVENQLSNSSSPVLHPVDHYFLLPLYAWGVSDWDLESIFPIIRKFHPTVGFSIHEACLATRVTIVGSHYQLSSEAQKLLQDAGCFVDRLDNDGIFLAI